jgi:hypothetical protein
VCVAIDVSTGYGFMGGGGMEAGHGRMALHAARWLACSTMTNANYK